MIPTLNDYGCLPEGIYDCTMDEAAERFGVFQSSDRRPRLWARFTEFIRQVKACGFVETVIVDGSFVTVEAEPRVISTSCWWWQRAMIFQQICRLRTTAYWLNGGCVDGLGLI